MIGSAGKPEWKRVEGIGKKWLGKVDKVLRSAIMAGSARVPKGGLAKRMLKIKSAGMLTK
jgi:hypothetical protein